MSADTPASGARPSWRAPGAARRSPGRPTKAAGWPRASLMITRLGDALGWIASQGPDLPACLSFVTGPSNTADIASVQVVGVHGPGEVFVWIVSSDEHGR
jgi:L-lactate dehydrogenase complex protein LldG